MIERDVFVTAWIYDCAFFGTLAPFFRASESPIAIACLRLFTTPPLPPLPERSVPFFSRRIALSTLLPAAFPYLLPDFFRELLLFFFATMQSSLGSKRLDLCESCALSREPRMQFRSLLLV